jgi:endonuclease/exonuclease/phosphatase family metal-dependent hydrolase
MSVTAAEPEADTRAGVTREPRTTTALALVAVSTVLTFEVLRTLYPLGYSLVGDLGFVVTPAVLALLFLSPLLAAPAARMSPAGSLVVAAGGLAAARLLLQVLAPPGLAVTAIAVVVTLPAFTLLVGRTLDMPNGAVAVALGVASGVGLDAALKGAYAAWDRVWQPGPGPVLVTSLLAATLVGAALWLRDQALTDGEPRRGRLARTACLTLLLMPTMLLHGSIGFVASSGRVGLASSTLVVAGGAALAVLVAGVIVPIRRRLIGAGAALALAAATWWSTSATGDAVLVVSVLAQVATAVLLVVVLTDEPRDPRAHRLLRTAGGATLGFMALFALTLLHPMHYEMPLPVTNQVLPVLAVALAALGLLAPRDAAAAPAVQWRAVAAPAVAVAGIAAIVSFGIVATAHERADLVAARWPVTVGSLNVDQGATESGVLDFDAVADTIALIDADVVALQEVGRGWPLSGMNDLALWLDHERGTNQYFAPAADQQFGNLLITRVNLANVRTLPLPRGGGSMDRSAIVATVPTGDGDLTLYAVHLQHRNSDASIAARAEELAVLLDEWSGAPRTILLGDLNANNQRAPDGGPKLLVGPAQANTLQPLLDAGFTTTQPTQRCTLPTSNDNCSDYVLVSPDLLQSPSVEVLAPAPIGDHRPIRSVIIPR